VNPNSTISAPVTQTVEEEHTLVVSVATGTHSGPAPDVGCSDDAGNFYTVAANRNTGNGRLFVCVATVENALVSGENVTATYPGFSGVSAISVVEFDDELGWTGDRNTGSGSNPPVNSGSICVQGGHWVFGVVANTNISTFVLENSPPWFSLLPTQSGGAGAGKRTLSPAFAGFTPGGPCSDETLTGHLTGSGFWQAAIIGLRGLN
jgi:hypothetical protein